MNTTVTTTINNNHNYTYGDSETEIGEMKLIYKILIGKPEGNKPLGRPRINAMTVLNGS
jgi:hypothetical protein